MKYKYSIFMFILNKLKFISNNCIVYPTLTIENNVKILYFFIKYYVYIHHNYIKNY